MIGWLVGWLHGSGTGTLLYEAVYGAGSVVHVCDCVSVGGAGGGMHVCECVSDGETGPEFLTCIL